MTELNSLKVLWRGHDDSSLRVAHDWVTRTHRRRRRGQVLSIVNEVLGGVVAAGVAIGFVVHNPGVEMMSMAVVVTIIVMVSWASTWRAVRALRRGRANATGGHLAMLLSDARASLKERRRYSKILILTTALIVPWALFILITHFDFYSATPWRGVVGFGGIAAILMGLRWKIRAKIEALEDEIQRLEAWLAAFALEG